MQVSPLCVVQPILYASSAFCYRNTHLTILKSNYFDLFNIKLLVYFCRSINLEFHKQMCLLLKIPFMMVFLLVILYLLSLIFPVFKMKNSFFLLSLTLFFDHFISSLNFFISFSQTIFRTQNFK